MLIVSGGGVGVGLLARRVPARGWAALLITVAGAASYGVALSQSPGENVAPTVLLYGSLTFFMFAAPVAFLYARICRRTAPDRRIALVALVLASITGFVWLLVFCSEVWILAFAP